MYIINFPQLVAGPIVRYPEIEPQLYKHLPTTEGFVTGIKRFILGLSKKVLIANTLAPIADSVFNSAVDRLSIGMTWIGILCYSLQIYFDFSGYSDMAIGLGKMFGFDFPENFNYPYISRSIKEFWRRWHISLSNWFRDYVYIPMGGSRKGNVRTYFNLTLIFFLCGLWHGANWTFVIWGLWHGCFLVLERLAFGRKIGLHPILQHGYTLLIITIGWVFFRSEKISYAVDYLKVMFGLSNLSTPFNLIFFPDSEILLALFGGIIASMPASGQWVVRGYIRFPSWRPLLNSFQWVFIFVLFIVSIMSLASGTYNPFIYFRF